jgi:hypothetical protein
MNRSLPSFDPINPSHCGWASNASTVEGKVDIFLLGKGESSDESTDALIGFPCGNVTIPDGSGNPAIFVAHTMHTVTPVCL